MQNIVYMIEFINLNAPNKYIGSKSNCYIKDDKIYGNRGLYEGSSRDILYKNLIKNNHPYILHILGIFKTYNEALEYEKEVHIKYDVVASSEFFNKSIATISTYNDPEYATYKHTTTNKIARLKRNHPLVLNGVWVGVTKNNTLSEEEKKKRGIKGAKNPFYGKTHNKETLTKIAIAASNFHKGKKKTDDQRKKMSESAKKRWSNYKKNKKN